MADPRVPNRQEMTGASEEEQLQRLFEAFKHVKANVLEAGQAAQEQGFRTDAEMGTFIENKISLRALC